MSAGLNRGAPGPPPNEALTLRRVHDPDRALLRQLEEYDTAAFGPTGLRTVDLAVMAEAGAVFTAHLGDKVVGGCQLMRMFDEPDFFYVVGFYVREPWRGRRLSVELLRLVTRECRALGAEGLVLTVSPDNAAALALYKGAGFAEDRFVPRFYGENGDRLVLRRRFSEED
jgi:[ribosomal protein S18]-alanine N-acetyltransferase